MKKLPSSLLEKVDDSEKITRFIIYSRFINKDRNRVKSSAFIPNPSNLQLSVSRICDLSDENIWALSKPVYEIRKKLYGRADIEAHLIRNEKLNVVSSEPPERHANVVGWHNNDGKIQKARHKKIALKLADDAKLVLCSSK